MRKIYLLSICVFSLFFVQNMNAQTQVPNGGFEQWQDTITCQHWNGKLSYLYGMFNIHFLSRTTDKYSGSYAAKIQTKKLSIAGVLDLGNVGLATLGDMSLGLSGIAIEGGKPINAKPTKLKGYYKYNNIAGDTMAIVLLMYKWNSSLNKRDTIAIEAFYNKNTVNTYTSFNMNISYMPSTVVPDSFNIILISSAGYAPQEGTIMFVDEMAFEYPNSGTDELENTLNVDLYPNPAHNYMVLNLNGNVAQTVNIIDALGRNVLFLQNVEDGYVVDTSLLTNGMYYAEIKIKNVYLTRKFIIAH